MPQPEPAYIALMAIAETPDRSRRLAVFVGTKGPLTGGPAPAWQVGFADADEAARWFEAGASGPDGAATLFDVPPPPLLDLWLNAGQVGLSDGKGVELDDRMMPRNGANAKTKLWIDHLIRIHFYAADTEFRFGKEPPSPMVRLDTAGFVVEEDDKPVLDPVWAVSRLRLDATTSWANFAAAHPRPDMQLEGYRVVGHVPLAVNAHANASNSAGRAKQFDTRAILLAEAVKRDQQGALWSSNAPKFRAIGLRFSDVDGLTPSTPVVPRPPRGDSFALTDLIGANVTDSTEATRAPLFANVEAFAAAAPDDLIGVRRQMGFRKIADGEPLVLRAELHLALETPDDWSPLWDGLAGPATGLERPPEALRTSKSDPCLILAQEQLLADIETDFGGFKAAEWRATARFEQEGSASIDRFVARAISAARAYSKSPLRSLRPQSGMSTIPEIDIDGATPLSWYAVGGFRPLSTDRCIYLGPDNNTPWSMARWKGERLSFRSLQPVRANDSWANAPQWRVRPVELDLSTLTRIDGNALALVSSSAARLEAIDDARADTRADASEPDARKQPHPDDGICFQLSGHFPPGPSRQRLRIGALQFDLRPGTPFVQTIRLRFDREADRVPRELELKTRLKVMSAVPIEQDRLGGRRRKGERLGAPVLIRMGDAIVGEEKLELVGTENFDAGTDQQVEWSFEGPNVNASGKLLVIDPQPFRVAAVDYSFRQSAENNQIALWRKSDDGNFAWRVSDPNETVRMLLPPQIIGESMERYINGGNRALDDIAPGKAAAARFGSLTRIDFDPTWRETGTREPGWNLRRVFDRIADAAPGALVRDLRFELAYGLIARHQPQRETWLAEMSGIMGAAPDDLEAKKDDPARFVDYGNKVLALADHRLAVDKLWSGRPEQRFETQEALTFTLRTKTATGGPRTKLRFPVAGGYPSAGGESAERLRKTFQDPEAAGPPSFAGGVAWAFQSANILAEAYDQPFTTEGQISDIFFSALGGWGQQRAAFAQGKSIIETETAMGRLSVYKLERLGRIGALGHRAKHVIVYRRTVAPSAQFFNDDPIRIKQDEHAGRPILRKVEEYVDILEPERHYPEKGSSTREPGCLSGARFVSRRIRVDSDWGGDVRNEGWMVPLWRADMANTNGKSDPRDPDSPANIYPKPLVQLLMPGEAGDEVPVAIDTPERLVFYTSTLKGETADNIDDWHAVESVDFCDAPAPRVEAFEPRSDALHDGTLPPAPRSAGGHDRLTLALVDTRLPIRIGAGRTETSPAAPLKNVTISRARPRAMPEPASTEKTAIALAAGDEAGNVSAKLRARLDRMFGTVSARFEGLGREILGGRERAIRAVDEARNELKAELNELHKDIDEEARKLTDKLGQVAFDRNALAEKLTRELREQLEKERNRLKKSATGAIELGTADLLGRAENLTKRWSGQFNDLIDELKNVTFGQPIAALQQSSKDLLDNHIRPALRALKGEVVHTKQEIESLLLPLDPAVDRVTSLLDFRPELRDGQRVLTAALVQAKTVIAQTRRTVAGWQPFGSADDAAEKKAELLAVLADARSKLVTLTGRLQTLATSPGLRPAASHPDTGLLAAAIKGLRGLDTVLADLELEAEKVVYPPANFPLLLADLDGFFAKLETDVQAAQANVDQLVLGAIDGITALKTLFKDVATQLQKDVWTLVLDPLAAKADDAEKAIDQAEQAAIDFYNAGQTATVQAELAAHNLATVLKTQAADFLTEALSLAQADIRKVQDELLAAVAAADSALGTGIDDIVKAARKYLLEAGTVVAPAQDVVAGLQRQIAAQLDAATTVEQEIEAQIDAFADALIATINSIADEADKARAAIEAAVTEQARRIAGRLESYLGGVERELSRQLGVQPGDLIDGVAVAADRARYLYQEGDNVLRLIRAVGDPPKTDALGFNRPEVAYVFDVLKPVVDVTPVLALANRVTDTASAIQQAADAAGNLLESFGIRLPVGSLGEDLIPDKLKDLSLGKLFPDFAGLNLESLLKNAGFPDLSGKDSQGVKITRGFDKERREAWLQAEIDVTLSRSEAILDIGPIALMIDEGQFRAETRVAMGADGRVEKQAKGQIAGDWRLVTAGMDIITFEKTPLLFDKSGKIDFKIATDRVRLAPTLEFLTNLMAKVGKALPAGVEPIMRGGIPAGLITKLSMQLPPIQTGAFAVTDLNLAVGFGIVAIPEFEMLASLDIASRDAPFTLAVWLLNGGGYINQRLSYRPMAKPKPVLTYTLDVAIVAGVGIGFGFGVVSGGVWLQVGCSVALTWTTGGSGNVTTVTAFLLARGNVDIAGLVSANIMLRLEISYNGSTMVARGTLRLSFRISMFYTLRVNQAAQYQLVGERRSESSVDYSESFG